MISIHVGKLFVKICHPVVNDIMNDEIMPPLTTVMSFIFPREFLLYPVKPSRVFIKLISQKTFPRLPFQDLPCRPTLRRISSFVKKKQV